MDSRDIELVRVLQDEGIFLLERPFREAARLLGWTVEETIQRSLCLLEAGVIRRFAAALTPGKAGFRSNSMVAWAVDDGLAGEAGRLMAAHPRVSHCYERPRFEGFPFNIYTMVHATTPEDLSRVIGELSKCAPGAAHRALHTLRELKKSSPVYFHKAVEQGRP